MQFEKVYNQLMETGMDPFFTSKVRKEPKLPPPEDAYTFERGKISDEAWDQDKYWYNAKGEWTKIDDMSSQYAWGVMTFIREKFPQHIDSTLYNAVSARYVRARADALRDPRNRYYAMRRYEK